MPHLTRRTLIGAGAALLLPARLAAAPLDPRAQALVDAVNGGTIAAWAARALSPAGLARRSAAAVADWLAAMLLATGRWHLVDTQADSRRIRVTIATERAGQRRLDLLLDRAMPGRLFDLRPALDPLPYPVAPVPARDRAALARTLGERMAFAVRANGFSGAMLVADPAGAPCFAFAHGIADAALGSPVTADTRFNLGSCDKSFTAVLIGQLVEAGRLRFDMPVAEVLPALAASPLGRPTIAQLLAHSGGLGEPRGGILAYSRDPYARVGDLLSKLASVPPAFAPGSRTAYSNEGYVLLGAVIEAATGQDWWHVAAARIHEPEGMTRSGYPTRPELPGRYAIGYHAAPDDLLGLAPPVPNHPLAPWRGNACGGGYSTTADTIAWLRAFRSGRLMSAAMRDRLTAFTGHPHPAMAYGMGFARREANGRLWVGHSGGGVLVGIGAAMAIAPDSGWAVSVLTNRDVPLAEAILADTLALIPR